MGAYTSVTMFGTLVTSSLRRGLQQSRSVVSGGLTNKFLVRRFSTIGELVDTNASKHEHKDCLRVCHQDALFTFGEFKDVVDSLGTGLYESRIKSNDVLLTMMGNDPETFFCHVGCARIGAAVKPIHIESDVVDIATHMRSSDKIRGFLIPRVLKGVSGPSPIEKMNSVVPELASLDYGSLLKSAEFPHLRVPLQAGRDFQIGYTTFKDILVEDPMPPVIPQLEQNINEKTVSFIAGDNAVSQGAILSGAKSWVQKVGIKADDRVCVDLSHDHVLAQEALLGNMSVGAFSIMTAQRFDPDITLKNVAREHCTVVVVDSHQLQQLAEATYAAKVDLSRVTRLVVAKVGGKVDSISATSVFPNAKVLLAENAKTYDSISGSINVAS